MVKGTGQSSKLWGLPLPGEMEEVCLRRKLGCESHTGSQGSVGGLGYNTASLSNILIKGRIK